MDRWQVENYMKSIEQKGRKMTNADRIRSMTDEELASKIMCPYEREYRDCKDDCYECCLKWLKSEVGCE